MSVDIRVTVTDAEYRALLAIANRNRTQVHLMLEEQTRRALDGAAPIVRIERPASVVEVALPVKVKPNARVTTAEVEEIRRLHGERRSDQAIGRALGRPAATVALHRKRMGLSANGHRLREVSP